MKKTEVAKAVEAQVQAQPQQRQMTPQEFENNETVAMLVQQAGTDAFTIAQLRAKIRLLELQGNSFKEMATNLAKSVNGDKSVKVDEIMQALGMGPDAAPPA